MSDWQFKCFLEWLMCSDPWPASPEGRETMEALANEEAWRRKYRDWIEAYHAV